MRGTTIGPAHRRAIALDVGGTSVKSGVVASEGRVVSQVVTTAIDSTANRETIVAALATIIARHLAEADPARLVGIALGFPGPFDYEAGVSFITGVAKYEALYGLDVGGALRSALALDVPIVFRNDAEAAVVGEGRYSAGRSYRRLIGITLGTGIGSAFLAGGVPATSGAGVPPNGWLYSMPFGDVQADDVFSIRGLRARLRAAGLDGVGLLAAADQARRGNAALQCLFDEFGTDLATFLHPFVRDFRADALLALGGLTHSFDLFGHALGKALPVPVIRGQLGARAALLGAAELLFHPEKQGTT